MPASPVKPRPGGPKRGLSRRSFIKRFGSGAIGGAVLPDLLSPAQTQDLPAVAGVPVRSVLRIAIIVNGARRELDVEPRETLLDVLRERLGLTGSKKVCDRGECGGCTVLLDGEPVYACMTPAARADGRAVTTIEGLARDGRLHPLQEEFIARDGYQCGFCAPGFIMASAGLLAATPDPTEEQIRAGLSGNLCRCGNYARIREAVSAAAKRMRKA